jgi:hypothetical protein
MAAGKARSPMTRARAPATIIQLPVRDDIQITFMETRENLLVRSLG